MLDDKWKTGNKKMDEKIEIAFSKDPVRPNRLQRIITGDFPEEKENKYKVSKAADRTYNDGTVFSSKKEMYRWDDLLKLQQAGEIKDLQRQVSFVLTEEFIHPQYGKINKIVYISDFVYTNISFRKGFDNRECVEDSKGMLTDEYKLKRKLFLYKYPEYLFFEV